MVAYEISAVLLIGMMKVQVSASNDDEYGGGVCRCQVAAKS